MYFVSCSPHHRLSDHTFSDITVCQVACRIEKNVFQSGYMGCSCACAASRRLLMHANNWNIQFWGSFMTWLCTIIAWHCSADSLRETNIGKKGRRRNRGREIFAWAARAFFCRRLRCSTAFCFCVCTSTPALLPVPNASAASCVLLYSGLRSLEVSSVVSQSKFRWNFSLAFRTFFFTFSAPRYCSLISSSSFSFSLSVVSRSCTATKICRADYHLLLPARWHILPGPMPLEDLLIWSRYKLSIQERLHLQMKDTLDTKFFVPAYC